MNILSIDFDYWVVQLPHLIDCNEGSYTQLNTHWWNRLEGDPSLRKSLKADESCLSFIDTLKKQGCRFNLQCPIVIRDSHKHAYKFCRKLNEPIKLWNVDNHHDICYGYRPWEKSKQPCCGTWIGMLIRQKQIISLSQHYPSSRLDFPEHEPVLPKYSEIEFEYEAVSETRFTTSNITDVTFDGVYICRSGGWNPPWNDPLFVSFVKQTCQQLGQEIPDVDRMMRPQTRVPEQSTHRDRTPTTETIGQ